MLSILVIAIGIAVLLFGKRVAVLGAAVGALLGVGLLRLLGGASDFVFTLLIFGLVALIGFLVVGYVKGKVSMVLLALGTLASVLLAVVLLGLSRGLFTPLLSLLIPGLLALIGFLVAGITKGIANIVLLVLGTLAGAGIALAVLDLFSITSGSLDWLLAIAGGVIGLIMVMRFKDWAMLILSGLIGGLLVTRGLTTWLPFLNDIWGTLLVIVLAGLSIAYQGGFFGKRKAAG